MLTKTQIQQQVAKTRSEDYHKRNFQQSFELILTLKDIDVKKLDLNVNEVVFLPNKLLKKPRSVFLLRVITLFAPRKRVLIGLLKLENWTDLPRKKDQQRNWPGSTSSSSLIPD